MQKNGKSGKLRGSDPLSYRVKKNWSLMIIKKYGSMCVYA
jgi:hypothetical protein